MVLKGETHHRDLLRSSLTEDSVANCLAVICLDFMQPWLIEESLEKWLGMFMIQLVYHVCLVFMCLLWDILIS
jgi:hypothetical protein